MRCLKEKELILFYYREIPEGKLKEIEIHLKECGRCFKRYETIESLFKEITQKRIILSSQEVESMVEDVRQRIYRLSFWEKLKDGINELLQILRYGIVYKPQFVTLAVLLIVALSIVPMAGKKMLTERDFNILQIEIELSLDNPEGSIFDLYEGDLSFINERSYLGRSILGSRIGAVRRKT